jgi:O-antigen ligase
MNRLLAARRRNQAPEAPLPPPQTPPPYTPQAQTPQARRPGLPPIAAAPAAPPNQAQSIGMLLVLVYLFFFQSRVLDFTLPEYRIPLILYVLLALFAVASGRLFTFFENRTGRLLTFFFLWCVLAVPFSIHRVAALPTIVETLRYLLLGVMIAALLQRIEHLRAALKAIAWGTLVAGMLGFIFQGTSLDGSRLSLSVGRFGDPNDYAMVLLMGLPLWLLLARGLFGSLLALAATGVILASFLKTGSRGGLIAFVALTVSYFIATSVAGKIRVLLAVTLFAVLAVIFVPATLKSRYLTLFSADATVSAEDQTRLSSSIDSTNSRLTLLLSSIKATALHPIFGVGPGLFPEYFFISGFAEEKRNRQGMHTHNTFTQVSSEAGIPAAVLFLIALLQTIGITRRAETDTRFPEDHPLRQVGRALRLSVTSWAVAALFLSTAWHGTLFLYASLAIGLLLAHQQLLNQLALSTLTPAPANLPTNLPAGPEPPAPFPPVRRLPRR